MLISIVFLVLGAILGAVFSYFLCETLPAIRVRQQEEKRQSFKEIREECLENVKLTGWLLDFHEYYKKKYGVGNDLRYCRIDEDHHVRIPFLSKKEWDAPNKLSNYFKINPKQNKFVKYAETSEPSFDIDHELIKEREQLGQRIWNAPTLYLENISFEEGWPIFYVQKCDYYASVTRAIALENETIEGVKSYSFENCKIRKENFLRIGDIEQNLYQPMTLGCMVVFALKTKDGYDIILQTRSKENATANGVTSIVPTFGLSPFVGEIPKDKGILYYNFLKEYLEELCGRENLVRDHAIKGPAQQFYDWIYERPEVKPLTKNRKFNLYYIGFGFNLINGYPNIGLLAKLDNKNAWELIKDTINPNWEIAEPSESNDYQRTIRLVNHKSNELRIMITEKQLDPASLFFLSSALKYMD